uniref:Dynein light chain n=1 Tax=Oryza glumipatula TaxID=40148 RepID=A0A0E0A9W4_9ORYZ
MGTAEMAPSSLLALLVVRVRVVTASAGAVTVGGWRGPPPTSTASRPPRAPRLLAPPPPPPLAGHKIQIKSANMKEEMRQEAFDIDRVAFEKHTMEKDIVEYIKKEFDKNHGPTWHCIVGHNFGCRAMDIRPPGPGAQRDWL